MFLNPEALEARWPQSARGRAVKPLAANDMLVKRPLLIADGFVLMGFKEPE